MATPILSESLRQARDVAARIDADFYVFNGTVEAPRDLSCMLAVHKNKKKKTAILLLVTDGGSPDAAYKVTRYFQEKYDRFTVLVPGRCKSAGTLIAVGAQEIAFTPYGELGPLDIQLTKVDKFDQLQSGLTIQDSLTTLEGRALDSFYRIVKEYMQANDGLLSFPAASKAASDFVTQLYAPIFSRIDPEEVGARARSMRIAIDYGQRLAIKGQNLKPETLKLLAEKYSSHSFVIDQSEAEQLFLRVRSATKDELEIVRLLGKHARYEVPARSDFVFCALSGKDVHHGKRSQASAAGHTGGGPSKNGGNPKGTARPANAPPANPGRRAGRSTNGSRPSAGAQGR